MRFCGYPLRGAALPATSCVVVPTVQSGTACPTLAGRAPSSNHATDRVVAATCCRTGASFCIETGVYTALAEVYRTPDRGSFRVATSCHWTTLRHHFSDTRPEHKSWCNRNYHRAPFPD